MANGQFLHGVDLMPVPFYEFSETDDKIVRLAVEFLEAENPIEPDYCQDPRLTTRLSPAFALSTSSPCSITC